MSKPSGGCPSHSKVLCCAWPLHTEAINTPTSRLCLNPVESTCQLAATAADLLRYEPPPWRFEQPLPQRALTQRPPESHRINAPILGFDGSLTAIKQDINRQRL